MPLGLFLILIQMLPLHFILHLSNQLVPLTFQILRVITILGVWVNFHPLNQICSPHLMYMMWCWRKGTMIGVGSFKKLGLLSYHGLRWLLWKLVDCTLLGARYVCRKKERKNYLLLSGICFANMQGTRKWRWIYHLMWRKGISITQTFVIMQRTMLSLLIIIIKLFLCN